jgi:hypothetical protein
MPLAALAANPFFISDETLRSISSAFVFFAFFDVPGYVINCDTSKSGFAFLSVIAVAALKLTKKIYRIRDPEFPRQNTKALFPDRI